VTPPAKQSALKKSAETSIDLAFADNKLAIELFGSHHANLARIEQAAGVNIFARGNTVAVSGSVDATAAAVSVLNGLYERLERGLVVGPDEVDAVLRMAMADGGDVRDADLTIRTRRKHISPRSPMQANYLRAIEQDDMVFGLGPAGTGKTYLAVAKAVEKLMKGEVDRLILSRPAVEAGENLGFLPGDMREKIDPYLRPLYDAIDDMMPADQVTKRMESGEIEIAPLAFMRGRTLSNACVILDEAQNTTAVQMKMFLTRLGENAQMVITGDLSQVDLPRGVRSGLRDAMEVLQNVEGISFVQFSDKDVVRHRLVSRIVRAYDSLEKNRHAAERYEHSAKQNGHDDGK
jgi:phosphate starvation-inducible protein PhoH and related proteins